jgi:hypothetical protein
MKDGALMRGGKPTIEEALGEMVAL